MFVVRVKGEFKDIWFNKKEDDFIQFLPKYFGCEPSDLELEYIDEKDQRGVRQYYGKPGYAWDFNKTGKIELNEINPQKEIPPSLRVGDDDPDNPGTPVKEGDPRTKRRIEESGLNKIATFKSKKVKKWPYDDKKLEAGKPKFKGIEL